MRVFTTIGKIRTYNYDVMGKTFKEAFPGSKIAQSMPRPSNKKKRKMQRFLPLCLISYEQE